MVQTSIILTGHGLSRRRRSFIALELADEKRAFEVAKRLAETTGRDVTVRDANWVELTTFPGGKKH